MKVLVLGSEGFIGNHAIRHFLNEGHEVVGCDLLDLKNPDYPYFKISRFTPGFEEIFQSQLFDVCVNAAGSGSVPLSITHPFADFEANTVDTFRILECVRQFNAGCKYLNISSAAVYGNPKSLPIRESDSLVPLSPYGWHKFYGEQICREYSLLYGISTCSLRPFSVYGPGLKKQLFWDIYQKTLASKTLALFGTGEESRDFIYITDLIECIALLVQHAPMKGEAYNAASGEETTIATATAAFVEALGPGIHVSFSGESRPGDPNNWRADISSIAAFGYKAQTQLQQGLYNFAQWLKEKK